MKPHELARGAYKKNAGSSFSALHSDDHSLQVDVHEWPLAQDRVKFDADDFPYFKMALLDRYLEDEFVE